MTPPSKRSSSKFREWSGADHFDDDFSLLEVTLGEAEVEQR